jgi:hypothetical protein
MTNTLCPDCHNGNLAYQTSTLGNLRALFCMDCRIRVGPYQHA